MLPPPIFTAKPPKHRKARPVARAGPAALTLVSATYQAAVAVRLTFDRPVDVDAADVSGVFVDDGATEHTVYQGDGPPSLDSPTTVLIALAGVTTSAGSGVRLTAPADTGIVAADDGAAWAGVTDLELPFGS